MLSETLVVDYIKRNLGFPVMQLEITDDDIVTYVRNYTIPFFSRYKPYEQYIVLDTTKEGVKQEDGTYKIPLDPDHTLISIVDVVPTMSAYFASNFPYNPMPSWESLPEHFLKMMKSLTQQQMSMFAYTWKLIPPDKLYIMPKQNYDFLVIHGAFTHTFDTIPLDWERHFLDLALADIYDYIASLRVKYQNMTTPYGDINLNWDYFQNRAENLRNRVLEDLRGAKLLKYCYVR